MSLDSDGTFYPPRRRDRYLRRTPQEISEARRKRYFGWLTAVPSRFRPTTTWLRERLSTAPGMVIASIYFRSFVGFLPGAGDFLFGNRRDALLLFLSALVLLAVFFLTMGATVSYLALLGCVGLSVYSVYRTFFLIWSRWNLPPAGTEQKMGVLSLILSAYFLLIGLIVAAYPPSVPGGPGIVVVGGWFQTTVLLLTMGLTAFLVWRLLMARGAGR